MSIALPSIVIPSGARASYLQQTERTNNAAVVAPGAVKPTSVYGLTPKTLDLSVFAHLSEPIDRFALDDAQQLARWIADELIAGLTTAVEAATISAVLATSGIQVSGPGADVLGTLRTALTRLTAVGFDSNLIFVMSPESWEIAETSRAAGGAGTYDFPSAPVDSAARRLWGQPVVLVNGLPANTALALDRTALALYSDRQGIRVDWGSPGDTWTRNEVVARCEWRAASAVHQGFGIVKVTLPAAA